MLHNIAPHQYHVEFQNRQAQAGDFVFPFCEGKLLVKEQDTLALPRWQELPADPARHQHYLLGMDEDAYFYTHLTPQEAEELCQAGYTLLSRQQLRSMAPQHLMFAAVTAFQLDGWYTANRYCGRCATPMLHDSKERMVRCPSCGNLVYPRINPAVIVGVTDGDRILLSKYAGRGHTNYALIAGFTEIGETYEQTVAREVMEEVGLRVKNIRYYKSQPWGIDGNILAGFYCDLDGSDEIHLDENELSMAGWYHRDGLPIDDDGYSLTREMIRIFGEGREPK